MYICPICYKQFEMEDTLIKHMSKCLREKNPTRKSKPAPRSEDINTREVSADITSFFKSFNKE